MKCDLTLCGIFLAHSLFCEEVKCFIISACDGVKFFSYSNHVFMELNCSVLGVDLGKGVRRMTTKFGICMGPGTVNTYRIVFLNPFRVVRLPYVFQTFNSHRCI